MQLSEKNSWLYLIHQNLNGRDGFGITKNVSNRLIEGYCNPSASNQEFWHLYYGEKSQIEDLEYYIKTEWYDHLLVLRSGIKLEWLDPKAGLTGQDLKKLCDDRIMHYPYKNVFSVKSQHLPYKGGNYFKNIDSNPDEFLEKIG